MGIGEMFYEPRLDYRQKAVWQGVDCYWSKQMKRAIRWYPDKVPQFIQMLRRNRDWVPFLGEMSMTLFIKRFPKTFRIWEAWVRERI